MSAEDLNMVEPISEKKHRCFHWKSFLGILIISSLLGFNSPFGILVIDAKNLAAIIFQVSGTMVALALPAAQLSYSFIAQFDRKLGVIFNEDIADSVRRIIIDETRLELKNNLFPAWRAIVYVFIAFILSALAIISPHYNVSIQANSIVLCIDNFIVGLSLGTLLVGSYWFYPTARYAFYLEWLDKVSGELPTNSENSPNERQGKNSNDFEEVKKETIVMSKSQENLTGRKATKIAVTETTDEPFQKDKSLDTLSMIATISIFSGVLLSFLHNLFSKTNSAKSKNRNKAP